jgi:hypothetical protein
MEPIPALPLVHTCPYCETTEILELITKKGGGDQRTRRTDAGESP